MYAGIHVSKVLEIKVNNYSSESRLKAAGAWYQISTGDDVVCFHLDAVGVVKFKDLVAAACEEWLRKKGNQMEGKHEEG